MKSNNTVQIDRGYLGQKLLSRGFRDWFLYMFNVTNGNKFIISPVHELLFEQINDIIAGKDTRVNINLCPRSGKTTLATWLTVYALTVNPKAQIIYTSYSQDLLGQVAKQIISILASPIYNAMYGMGVMAEDIEEDPVNDFWREYLLRTTGKPTYSSKKIITAQGGIVLFSAIGGQITGFGAGIRGAKKFSGLLIIDDANKVSDRRSDKMLANTQEYFVDTLLTRLNNSDTPIANIQQRVHLKDLSGFLSGSYGFKTFKFPLLNDEGACNLPLQYTEQRIKELQVNPSIFSAQYQQEPTIEGGNLFKDDMFIRGPLPHDFDFTFMTVDTAYKEKEENDFTVAGFFGVRTFEDGNKRLYLLDIIRKKIRSSDCEAYLVPFMKKYNTGKFVGALIEPKGHGIYLNQKMPTYGIPMQSEDFVDNFFSDRRMDKVSRANVIIPMLNTFPIIVGEVINDNTFGEIKNELMNFPKGEHDDSVDVIVDAVRFTYNRPLSILDVV